MQALIENTNLKILAISAILSFIPVIFWYIIIKRKNRKGMALRFFLAFILAGIGALYFVLRAEKIVDSYLESQDLPFFSTFIFIGLLITLFKNIVVQLAGIRYFKNIDDVIDLSFASALGYTFFENIIFFYITFSGQNPEAVGPIKMLKYFLEREFFILPIHLFCSGLFGYFYGLSIFASPELKKSHKKDSFWYSIMYFLLSLIFIIPKKFLFIITKITQGTIISVGFYALFFVIQEYDPYLSDILNLANFKTPIDERLMPLIAFGFFKIGSLTLFSLMDQKRRFDNRNMLIKKT
jgi:hypothetical protein